MLRFLLHFLQVLVDCLVLAGFLYCFFSALVMLVMVAPWSVVVEKVGVLVFSFFNVPNSVLISGLSLDLFLPVSGLGVVAGGLLALGVLCSGA